MAQYWDQDCSARSGTSLTVPFTMGLKPSGMVTVEHLGLSQFSGSLKLARSADTA